MFRRITVIMFDSFMLIVSMTSQVRNRRAFGAALFAALYLHFLQLKSMLWSNVTIYNTFHVRLVKTLVHLSFMDGFLMVLYSPIQT